eukprot:c22557_g1_i3 orf=818-1582(-)
MRVWVVAITPPIFRVLCTSSSSFWHCCCCCWRPRRKWRCVASLRSGFGAATLPSALSVGFVPACLKPIRLRQFPTVLTRTRFYCSNPSSSSAFLSMEEQFQQFRFQLEESGAVREKLRSIIANLDNTTRLMHAQLLLVHHSPLTPEILSKAKLHVETLRTIYAQLAEVIKGCPGQYYRYHDHWRNQTHTVVFLLTFLHWLETAGLLSHTEIETLLCLKKDEFGIDVEDYLVAKICCEPGYQWELRLSKKSFCFS